MSTFADLGKRLIVSALLIAGIGGLLVFAQHPLCKLTIVVFTIVFTSMGIYEYFSLLPGEKEKATFPYLVMTTVLALGSVLLSTVPALPFFVLLFLGLFSSVLYFRQVKGALHSFATAVFPLVYIVLPMLLLLKLLYGDFSVSGGLLVAYVIAVTKMGDIFGYFFGKLFGRHKLAMTLSPKKTKEGAVAAIIGAIATSMFFSVFTDGMFTFGEAAVLGGVLGIVGIVGDLAESLLKRDAGVKDSNSLPGLGGALDTLDSLLFAIPVGYFYFVFQSA